MSYLRQAPLNPSLTRATLHYTVIPVSYAMLFIHSPLAANLLGESGRIG